MTADQGDDVNDKHRVNVHVHVTVDDIVEVAPDPAQADADDLLADDVAVVAVVDMPSRMTMLGRRPAMPARRVHAPRDSSPRMTMFRNPSKGRV